MKPPRDLRSNTIKSKKTTGDGKITRKSVN